MSNSPGRAEAFAADVGAASRRATCAMAALGLTLGLRVYSACVELWQNSLLANVGTDNPPSQEALELSDTLTQFGGISQLLLLAVTAVLFLRWLHITVRLTRALGGETLAWQPKDAVWGFFIPFVSLVRPYRVIRDVHDQLEPDLVPEPPPKVVADETTGYREVKITMPPPPLKLPHAGIGAWWASWWVANLLSRFATQMHVSTASELTSHNHAMLVSDLADIVSAALALLVVRALDARLRERFRRVRHTPDEQLAEAGVTIQSCA